MLYNVIQYYTMLYSVIQYSLLSPGVGMYVLNTEYFGHLLRPNTYSSLQEAANAFLNFKLQTLGRHSKVRSYLPVSLPVLHLGCCLWQYKWDGQYCRWRIRPGRRWVPSIIVIFPHVLSLMCEAQELMSMFISFWLFIRSWRWCMNPWWSTCEACT